MNCWRYKQQRKGYAGIHFRMSREEAASLAERVEEKSRVELSATLLSADEEASSVNGPSAFSSFTTVTWACSASAETPATTASDHHRRAIEIAYAQSANAPLVQALRRVASGEDDFCVEVQASGRAEEVDLWFWLMW